MKKSLLFTLLMFAFCLANAQLTGWQYALPITINNTGSALTNYQIKLTVSTSSFVTASQMNAVGNDIRFATDGCGTNLLPYYIESGMNSTTTNIWVKVDDIPAGGTKKVYMFFGNATATAASTLSVFNGPYSAMNGATGGTTATAANSQYGFRFEPNRDILVTSFGKYEPTGSQRYVTLFNYGTQAQIKQVQVSGAAATYSYANTTPVWLTQGTQYLLEMFNGSGDSHYYGTTGSLNSELTFYDTRYCQGCTQNTFPGNDIANTLYGYPDFEFYTLNTAATLPTYSLGTVETPVSSQTPAVTIVSTPSGNICPGSSVAYTAIPTNGGSTPAYQWKLNGSNVGVNNIAYTSPTLVAGDVVSCEMTSSLTCVTAATATYEMPAVLTTTAITSQPSNIVSCYLGNPSFTVVAEGSNLTYQWEINTGSGFVTLSNGGKYSGVDQATLTITGAAIAMHNHKFRCIVSGSCGTQTSADARLEVYNPTNITAEPPATRIQCPGTSTTLNLTASGGLLVYKWQVNTGSSFVDLSNNATYSGTTTNSLTMSNLTESMNGYKYRCVVTGGCGGDISAVTDLTVLTATAITSQPVDKKACYTASADFSVVANGDNITYQWEINTGSGFVSLSNGGSYSGVDQATLTVSNATISMHDDKFRCIVNGTCGTVTSGEGKLEVYNPTTIMTEPTATIIQCPATNTTLALTASGGLLTYQWQVNTGSGYSNITNNSVYSGATTNSLGMTGLTVSMNGYKYRCVVKGGCGNDTSIVTDLTVYTTTAITTQPVDKKPCVGTTVDFTVAANGSNRTYAWEINTGSGFTPLSNGGAYSGADQATLTVSNTTLAMDNNKFRCVVQGSCGSETSAEAKLNVNPQPAISITSPATSVCANLSLQFTAAATDAGTPPNYQWKKNGTNVGTNSTTYTAWGLQTNDVITCELGVTSLCPAVPTLTSNSITVTAIPTIPTSVTISSQYGANSCIGLPVTFTATPVNPGAAPVYQWKKNSANVGTNSPTYTTTGLVTGDVITCQLSSNVVCPDPVVASSNTFNMTLHPVQTATVTLTVTPDSVECAGNSITFNSHYTNGGANPQYQWQLNGADIPGAIQPTYSSSTLNDNDLVACVFSSSTYCIFPVTSTPVKVDITQPVTPSISISGVPISGGVKFTADIVNGGSNPVIQWRKEGKDILGENGTTYDAIGIKQDDVITAYLVSSIECTTSPVALSNGLTTLKVTGIKNVSSGVSELNLFPNPNKGSFTVRGTLNEAVNNPDAKVEVVNAIGQVVYSNTARIEGREINISVNMNGTYAAGMYTVRLVVDGNTSNIRFVIKD